MNSDIYPLYDNTVQLNYLEQAGRHRYLVDGKEKTGVTTILKDTLNSSPPMTWAMWEAINYLKANEGDYEGASKAYLSKSDTGKNLGSTIHDLIEQFLREGEIPLKDMVEYPTEVIKAINGFATWFADQSIDVWELEKPVYSRDGDYAGKLDALLALNGKVVLCDWKSTNASQEAPNGVYWHNFLQLGGYGYALKEMTGVEIDDYAVINVGKTGKTVVIYASDMGVSTTDCDLAFMATLNVYKTRRKIMKNLKEK